MPHGGPRWPADKYEFKRPELPSDLPYDEETEKSFRTWAHINGLSKKQASNLYDGFVKTQLLTPVGRVVSGRCIAPDIGIGQGLPSRIAGRAFGWQINPGRAPRAASAARVRARRAARAYGHGL